MWAHLERRRPLIWLVVVVVVMACMDGTFAAADSVGPESCGHRLAG